MQNTEYLKLPLYQDSECPDISSTGHYNAAMEILDSKGRELSEDIADEREARIAGDTALEEKLAAETAAREAADTALEGKVATETKAREDADNALSASIGAKADSSALAAETAEREAADAALGSRIDNAEAEISTNSADLTGIKGLTYGNDHVQLVEISNGEYSSPALDEIFEQIGNRMLVLKIAPTTTRLDAESLAVINSTWPNVLVFAPAKDPENIVFYNPFFPYHTTETTYNFISYAASNVTSFPNDSYPIVTVDKETGDITVSHQVITVQWAGIELKPFSIIGAGLKVVADVLTVDASALPSSGLTIITLGDAQADDVYAKVQAAWPNCVLRHGQQLYLPANTSDMGYGFAGVPWGTTTPGYVINSAGGDEYNTLNITGRATWGQIEQS